MLKDLAGVYTGKRHVASDGTASGATAALCL